MRLTGKEHRLIEAHYGIHLRVVFHRTDVTDDDCMQADDREGWWEHLIRRDGHKTRERARLYGPVRFVAKPGQSGRAGVRRWRARRA